MILEEVTREASSEPPVKYHGKWPFVRMFSLQVCGLSKLCFLVNLLYVLLACHLVLKTWRFSLMLYWSYFPGSLNIGKFISTPFWNGYWSCNPVGMLFSYQEPASVIFSLMNLLVHFQGFSSFLVLLYYKLPLGPKGPYYEYRVHWTLYGILSMNSWIWSTVFHSRLVISAPYFEVLDWEISNSVVMDKGSWLPLRFWCLLQSMLSGKSWGLSDIVQTITWRWVAS